MRPALQQQPAVDIASALGSCKPISENPHFGEMLEEELRNRLIMVKQALMKSKDDEELLKIQSAFSNKTFKVFCDMVNIVGSLEAS
mmetsp:Transcript_29116/g.38794  ORF Transcript_29116/g.38794 Transcript_29116/m.38794 type:complete len:86 (-) Transcript_29116:501-758(-)